jgi:hypothetical protein
MGRDPLLNKFIPEIAFYEHFNSNNKFQLTEKQKYEAGMTYFVPLIKKMIEKFPKYFKKRINRDKAAKEVAKNILEEICKREKEFTPR